MPLYVNMALDIDLTPDPVHLWTGEGNIIAGGVAYQSAMGIVQFGTVESGRSIDERTTITFPVVNAASRAALLRGVPADPARVYMILSEDYRTFTRVLQIAGTISNVRVENLKAHVEIETAEGDVDRQRPTFISHETQLEEFPGDNGLKDMAALEKGLRVRF